MIELNPCPLCGRENKGGEYPIGLWWRNVVVSPSDYDLKIAGTEYRYECECGAHTPWMNSRKEALDAWNDYAARWKRKETEQ